MADNTFLDEFKEYKNIPSDNTDTDTILNKILDGAEGYLKSQYQLYLEKESISKIYNGKNLDFIVLPSKYISLSNVNIDSVDIDLNNFYLNDNLLFYINNFYPSGIQNIKVDFDIGFETTDDIPKDLKLAFFILADKYYENIQQNMNNFDYVADSDFGRQKMLNTLPKNFYLLLQPHISISLGV